MRKSQKRENYYSPIKPKEWMEERAAWLVLKLVSNKEKPEKRELLTNKI